MFQENLNELQLAKEQLSRVEQERAMEKERLSRVEQERVMEMEKLRLSEERLRKVVLLMRKQGLSAEEIATETGLNEEELEGYTKE